jgi:puromycin-sensitive aminopeptidase
MTDDASFRLPTTIRPSHYAIHIAPNLQDWTFRGSEEIELWLKESSDAIELHAEDLEIHSATLTTGERELPVRVVRNAARQTLAFQAEGGVPRGEAVLRLEYTGQIGTGLRGMYRAQVGEDRYAFTQCEPTEARRVFVCADEPSFKARYTLSVEAPSDLTVLSNEPIESEQPGSQPGTKLVRFPSTPKMSAYLFALAVGKIEAGPVSRTRADVPVCVWTVPGKTSLVDFPTEAAVASLERLEAYFGIPYPYRKLDLLAVPDFEAGAMENSGAVFFRERRLLCERDAGLETRKSIALVIAHELAHQWFGNLVTMEWWDDLWLNEAFATWMEHVIVDEWKPEWNIWIDFQQEKMAPFHTDSLQATRAIHAPVANIQQASEMFDAITYEKGAAVLRMIEHYLSPATFREGVRQYIRDHVEANATRDHLFGALSEASGQPIQQVANDWIGQPGYPVVSAMLRDGRDGNASLELSQQRFFLDPQRPAPDQRWRVPMVLKFQVSGNVHEQRLLLDAEPQDVALGIAGDVDWLTGNGGENGFYRVEYDRPLLERLVPRIRTALGASEKVGFLGNQWALTRAGRGSAAGFLDLLRAFRGETERAVVETVVDRLAFFRQFLVEPAERPAFSRLVEELFRAEYEQLGWEPILGENEDTRVRRAVVLRALGRVARARDVVAEARRRLEQHWASPGSVDANLLDTLAAIVAQDGDEPTYQTYLDRAQHAATPEDQFRHLLGLGTFERQALIQRTQELTLTPTIPTQDVGLLLVRMFQNESGNRSTWRFVQEQWDALSQRLPPMLARRVIQATVNLAAADARQEVEAFFTQHPIEAASRALRQALEELELLAAFRERATPEVRQYLQAPEVSG